MAKDPAFLLYYKDILVSCADWDADVLGWYLRLICHQADKPEGLPNDVELLAQLAGVRMSQYQRFGECWKRTLEAKFEANASGKLINPRLSEVLEDRDLYKGKQSMRGTVGVFIKQAMQMGYVDEKALSFISKALFDSLDANMSKPQKKECFKRTLEAYEKSILAIAIVIKDKEVIEEKGVQGEEVASYQLQVVSKELPRPAHWPSEQACKLWFVASKSTEAEGSKFFFHYEAQNWCTSGINQTPILRWEAAAAKWLLNQGNFVSKQEAKNETKPEKIISEDKYSNIPQHATRTTTAA